MPVVKPISVHETPQRLIKYILNPDKNEEMKFATGICCHADPDTAFEEFREIFNVFADKNFYKIQIITILVIN